MITGLGDGQGLPNPVNGGVHGAKPRESEDDILSSTSHDIEKVFWGNPFDVGIEGAGVADCTGFVCSLVDVANSDRGGEFFCGEAMFSDELPVNARDVSTGVYQCRGVDDFKGVRGGDQLYGNTHRFVRS